ncbi:MAG: M17 family peptidase N-terminal domain-containing protein, partial [Bradyrhizobium sp.]
MPRLLQINMMGQGNIIAAAAGAEKSRGRQMSQPIKIDFVALAPVTAQTQPQGASKRGKSNAPQTLVIFTGQDFAFGAATKALVGAEGEAMIRRAAHAMKFKGKEQSALDIVAPAGFVADRLLVIGTGAKGGEPKAHGKAAKNGEGAQEAVEKPADNVSLGGFVLGKLGSGACALVAFDLPRPPKDAAVAAAEFAEGMRLRDYKFDLYKTKKDDDEPAATEVAIAVEDPAAAKREAKALDAEAEGVV